MMSQKSAPQQQKQKRVAVIADGTLLTLDEKHMPRRIPIQTPTTSQALLAVAHEHKADSLWILPTSRTSRWAAAYPQDFTQFGDIYEGRVSRESDETPLRVLHLWYRDGSYEERRSIRVHFPEHDARWGWQEITQAPTLLYSVLYLRSALGCEIEWGPGSVGRSLMEALNTGARASWTQMADLSALPRRAYAQDLKWKGLPDALPDGELWFHAYDKNSMYLGSCTSANLGEGTPEFIVHPTPGHALHNLALPGLWQTMIAESKLPYYEGGMYWLWTPELEFLRRTEQAKTEVLAAYIWPSSHQTLRSWGEHIWKTRAALSKEEGYRYPDARQAAYTAIKRIATQSLGWLAHKPESGESKWYRPDWWNTLVSNALAKMLYKIYALRLRGYSPCWANVDELGFLSPDPDPRTAIPGMLEREGQLGGFKHSYTLKATSELLERLRTARHDDCHDYLLDQMEKQEALHGTI